MNTLAAAFQRAGIGVLILVRVEVTAADIAAGKWNDGLQDPVALAMKRATGGRVWFVCPQFCCEVQEIDCRNNAALGRAIYDPTNRRYPMPAEAQAWIRAWDRERTLEVEGIVFEIALPVR